jgi:hypothetical protein
MFLGLKLDSGNVAQRERERDSERQRWQKDTVT